MKKLVLLGFSGTLAACGVDGPPSPPVAKEPSAQQAPEPGFSVSGEVQMGVVKKL